jgi:DNA repair exonuclease SbcCD ATPase subunit
MKKYLNVFLILVLVFLISTSVAFAIATPSKNDKAMNLKEKSETEKMDLKNKIQANKEEVKAEIEKTREEAKTKIEALKTKIQSEKDKKKAKISEDRILGREKALERFDKIINKLNTLKESVNSKITKLEARGINTDTAKKEVATVEAKIIEAKGKVAEISKILSESTNQLSKENKTKIRQLAQETQALLREVHQSLIKAIKYLRDTLKNKPAEEDTDTTDDITNTTETTPPTPAPAPVEETAL